MASSRSVTVSCTFAGETGDIAGWSEECWQASLLDPQPISDSSIWRTLQ